MNTSRIAIGLAALLWFSVGQAQAAATAADSSAAALAAGHYAEAAALLRPAAEGGNAQAQNDLGALYSQGLGVDQDDTQAALWFRKAAEQGHASAQYNFGRSPFMGTWRSGQRRPNWLRAGISWRRDKGT